MYDFSVYTFFFSASGMRHACDAGTSPVDSGGAGVGAVAGVLRIFWSSLHCIYLERDGLGSGSLWTLHIAQYHFICYAAIPTMSTSWQYYAVREARCGKSGVMVCTDMVFKHCSQKVVRYLHPAERLETLEVGMRFGTFSVQHQSLGPIIFTLSFFFSI
jgi:hypothetical protein